MARVAQPTFVPIPDQDRVRPSIPPPYPLRPRQRPGELRSPKLPSGPNVGAIGPDQGYALALAHRLTPRLRLRDGEDRHDVAMGVAILGSKRAAMLGRAPSSSDLEVAAGLFGYLADAPDDLVAYRSKLFGGLAHSYDAQRELCDAVRLEALALTPQEVADPMPWRLRLGVQ